MNAQQGVVFSGNTSKGLPVVIRYPRSEDLYQMWRMINALSQERTFIIYQGREITLPEEGDYLAAQLVKIRDRRGVQLLVFSGEELIGVASVDFLENTEEHIGSFGITVAKEFRGKGVGSKLMREVFKEASLVRPELEIMILWVFASNVLAIGMYERFGFREYGRLPRGIKLEHGYVDRVAMYKFLKE